MSSVITVENLGKNYTLHHQQREQYNSLRDVLTSGVASLGTTLLNLFHHKRKISPATHDPASEIFWALKDISFEVKQGERIGIIGRNGAGKSTLLKILSRITEPTTGSIRIKGRVASLLEVGTGFHPELTGRENIYLNGAILGMKSEEIRRKFDEIVDFAEIEKFLDTPVKRYSSGMYVRLAFAVAAHLDPEILLIDEVLAVGDAIFQKKCLGKIEDVSINQGRTVLFVSHNVGAIARLCDTVLVLKAGEKHFCGNANDGIAHYLNMNRAHSDVIKWDADKAPATTSARLLEVGLLSNGKSSGTEINSELPIQIYIVFEVLQEQKVGTSVLLYNNSGILVFASISNNEESWHGKARPAGVYRSICEIPANLLANGRYYVSIPLWEGHYESGIVEKDILSFLAVEHGLVRGDLPYESTGVIRPYLKWTSERCS